MAYSTPAEVRKALVPSSDGLVPDPPSHTAADMPDDQLLDAIAEADSTIDGYLGGRYATPVADVNGEVPHPLDYWSRTIAAYLASLTYRGSLDFPDTDPVARRYNAALNALVAVSKGQLTLSVPENLGPSSQTAVGTALNPYDGDLWQPGDFDIDWTHL